MKIKILSHQEYAGAILKRPTEEIEFPLSEENNIILDNMIKFLTKELTKKGYSVKEAN